MTKEQIEKKAEELGIKYQTPCHGVGDCEFEARQAAMEMSEWMISHQWVSVEDELPPKGEIVIAHYVNFSRVGLTFACWGGKGWMQEEKDVTRWMPIPPMVEEGGEE